MKKNIAILALTIVLITSVSFGALADTVSNNKPIIKKNLKLKKATPSPTPANSHKTQAVKKSSPSHRNTNRLLANKKGHSTTKNSRWSRFKSGFHKKVIQPIKSTWSHIKSHKHKKKSPKK